MPITSRWLVLVTALVALARPTYAQSRGLPYIQMAVGVSNSSGGDFEERPDYTIEALLAGRVRAMSKPALSAGLAVGSTFVNGSDLTCRIAPGGGCVPLMPRFTYGVVLAGVEARSRAGSAGLMGGPGAFLSGGDYRMGGQLRADFVSRSVLSVALVVSPRVLIIPNVMHSTLTLRSLSVGVRIR